MSVLKSRMLAKEWIVTSCNYFSGMGKTQTLPGHSIFFSVMATESAKLKRIQLFQRFSVSLEKKTSYKMLFDGSKQN